MPSVKIDYRRPARLDDALEIREAVIKLGRATIELRPQTWREETWLTEAMVRLVYVDARNQKIVPPHSTPRAVDG
ncbi:acyl-CoA thioesterase [Dyella subtropica]|uniref:acyl-CoA thioesterase n=1 Tax=Dyella subtropica TaxID=2992127 RepID=UPI003CE50ED6